MCLHEPKKEDVDRFRSDVEKKSLWPTCAGKVKTAEMPSKDSSTVGRGSEINTKGRPDLDPKQQPTPLGFPPPRNALLFAQLCDRGM